MRTLTAWLPLRTGYRQIHQASRFLLLSYHCLGFLSTKKRSFLQTARALKLDGPPDWSARLEEYLYGEGVVGE